VLLEFPVRHLLCSLLALLALHTSMTAGAQPAGGADSAEEAAREQELQALIEVLENDESRARLLERLRAAEVEPPPETASLATRLAAYTRSLGAIATGAAAAAREMAREASGVFTGAVDVDEEAVRNILLRLALLIAATFATYTFLRLLYRRAQRTLASTAARGDWVHKTKAIVASSAFDVATVLVAWGMGNVVAILLERNGGEGLADNLFLNAFLIIELVKAVSRTALAPNWPALRTIPIEDTNAAYWYFWLSRLVSLIGYTLLFLAPVLAANVSVELAEAVRIVMMFAALVITIAIVLQNRDAVRARLMRRTSTEDGVVFARSLATFARVWHMAAILYLLAVFALWVADPDASLPFVLWATVKSAVAILVGALLSHALGRLAARGLRLTPEVKQRLPLLEARLNAFVPNVLRAVRFVIAIAVILVIAQFWGLANGAAWLASEAGQRVLATLISVALILMIAGVIHLAVQSWIEYRLNASSGASMSPRERTLLALFRNAFTIVLAVLVLMLLLAELGVNIGPLLAGAGVIGLAVGFGAQKLVQDVITGAFIQLEDTLNEGDVITTGGVTGVVERLTIRSVSLRSLDGAYHLIPFSSVDTVTNLTKNFSYHIAAIGVAYGEKIPEVKQAMEDAFEKLRQTSFGAEIIGDFEMQGITEFADSAVVVRARIKTLPGKQWALGRAYSELVKEIFDERGIEIPFPHVTLYMGELKDGTAPPLRVQSAPAMTG
jgi:small conductance mechanosensitive channel